ASGVQWTVVRAGWFNQNFSEGAFLDLVMSGTVALPVGDVREPFVDCDDIADVAVAALTEPGHHGQIYEVTGPRLMTFSEAAQTIADAAGIEVQFVDVTPEEFDAGLIAEGVPADFVGLLNYLFNEVLDGRNEYLTDGVQQALGRPARDFVDYARQAAANGAWTKEVVS
ncbi:MAG: NmrA family transcriptional regulator, partial [Planctomycetota bacterium]